MRDEGVEKTQSARRSTSSRGRGRLEEPLPDVKRRVEETMLPDDVGCDDVVYPTFNVEQKPG
jgi:hypothetical protein